MTCVIFGGADIFDHSEIKVPRGAYVIAADRGYLHCTEMGIAPDLLVGDMDSIGSAVPGDVKTIKAPCVKDDTDLILAVREGIKHGCRDFLIYGADGGRMGHTYANIQTLSFISDNDSSALLHGKDFCMTVQKKGSRRYENDGYAYVSLFSLSENASLNVKGLKYGGSFTLRRNYPMGVSNEFISDSCEITVSEGELLVILEK